MKALPLGVLAAIAVMLLTHKSAAAPSVPVAPKSTALPPNAWISVVGNPDLKAEWIAASDAPTAALSAMGVPDQFDPKTHTWVWIRKDGTPTYAPARADVLVLNQEEL